MNAHPTCKCGHSTLDHWPGYICLVPRCECRAFTESASYSENPNNADPQPARVGREP